MRSYLVLVAVGLAAPHLASGDSSGPPVTALSFTDALGGVAALPDLVGASAAATATSRLTLPLPWAPVVVTVTPSLRISPSEQRGLEGGVAIQQAIPLDDVAGARREHLRGVADQRAAEAAALALDARLAAAAAWIDAWEARARLDIAERDLALARSIGEVTQRGVAAGAFTQPELADARAFVAEAVVRATDAEGAVAETSFALAATTGRPGRATAEGVLPSPAVPDAAAWPSLVERARGLPAVTARRLAARAARGRALEDHRARGHQLIVGGELLRDGPGAASVIATIGLALPHDRGEREAGLAHAEALMAEGQAETLAARAAVELCRALHDVEHTGSVLTLLERDLVPAADDAATRRKRAFELGETTLVELLAAQRTALAAHARVASARARHAWARVHAWLLLQTAEVA